MVSVVAIDESLSRNLANFIARIQRESSFKITSGSFTRPRGSDRTDSSSSTFPKMPGDDGVRETEGRRFYELSATSFRELVRAIRSKSRRSSSTSEFPKPQGTLLTRSASAMTS